MKPKRYTYPPSNSKNVEPKAPRQTKASLKSQMEAMLAEQKRMETQLRQCQRDLSQAEERWKALNELLGDLLNDKESIISWYMLKRLRSEIQS